LAPSIGSEPDRDRSIRRPERRRGLRVLEAAVEAGELKAAAAAAARLRGTVAELNPIA